MFLSKKYMEMSIWTRFVAACYVFNELFFLGIWKLRLSFSRNMKTQVECYLFSFVFTCIRSYRKIYVVVHIGTAPISYILVLSSDGQTGARMHHECPCCPYLFDVGDAVGVADDEPRLQLLLHVVRGSLPTEGHTTHATIIVVNS